MRLTTDPLAASLDITARRGRTRAWPSAVVIGALLMIFELDRITGAAPVQHLYYLPIIFAAIRINTRVGFGVSLAAVVLYHFANPVLLTLRHSEQDLVQIILFVAVGIVTGRLADNARRLHRLATTDDLTGLHNLRSFEARLNQMVRACREARAPLSMLVLDVDRLKSVNDTYGHLAGAETVSTLGHVIAARADFIANDLRRAINAMAPVLVGRRFAVGTLSISVGIACLSFDSATSVTSDDVETGRALFDAADRGLYAAKAQGRNRVSVAR